MTFDADIIFIKNIDNVCHKAHVEQTVYAKKKLAAIGLIIKSKIDNYLIAIDKTI